MKSPKLAGSTTDCLRKAVASLYNTRQKLSDRRGLQSISRLRVLAHLAISTLRTRDTTTLMGLKLNLKAKIKRWVFRGLSQNCIQSCEFFFLFFSFFFYFALSVAHQDPAIKTSREVLIVYSEWSERESKHQKQMQTNYKEGQSSKKTKNYQKGRQRNA